MEDFWSSQSGSQAQGQESSCSWATKRLSQSNKKTDREIEETKYCLPFSLSLPRGWKPPVSFRLGSCLCCLPSSAQAAVPLSSSPSAVSCGSVLPDCISHSAA